MDDDLPKPRPNMVIGESLDSISLAELEHRVQLLESEIARIRSEISRKQTSRTAADAFFKS